MSSLYRYAMPVEQTGWKFGGAIETSFSWEYADEREKLLHLYSKAKKQQWDQATRIDWSTDLDPENPMQIDDRMVAIYGTDLERSEREEFVVEGCHLMRERFDAREVWEFLGMPVDKCTEAAMISENQRIFRANLFSRIVPTVRDIGLWGPKVKKAYQDMGVMQFAETDVEARLAADEQWALDLDAKKAAAQ